MNFFKLYIGDYQRDTAHLSVTEHGAFLLMLQHYYATEKPLPTGKALHRMLRAQDKQEREAIDAVAKQFWTVTTEGLVNERADQEIQKASSQAETNRQIAVAREEARKKKREGHEPSTNRATNDQPNQTPDTRHHIFSSNEEKKSTTTERPVSVTDEAWQGFLALRRAKKAPVTSIALRGIEAEATKAGLTLQQALEQCCARGWTGFKADWMREDNQSPRAEAAQSLMRGLTRGIVGGHANVKLIA